MRELFTSTGRVTRLTYWKFFGVFYGFLLLMGFLMRDKEPPEAVKAVFVLIFFALGLIGIIVRIKRWHDRDKSGWWVLIALIPCIGGIWTLVECGFLPGTPGENQYGPDPRNR